MYSDTSDFTPGHSGSTGLESGNEHNMKTKGQHKVKRLFQSTMLYISDQIHCLLFIVFSYRSPFFFQNYRIILCIESIFLITRKNGRKSSVKEPNKARSY